jgi:hypothetical protein
MAEYTTRDAVEFSMNKDAANFKAAVLDLLNQKISDTREIKKVEVSSTFMSADNEGSQQSDENV